MPRSSSRGDAETDGGEAAGIRAHELSRLYGGDGGVPGGGRLPVLSGDICDTGEQRRTCEDCAHDYAVAAAKMLKKESPGAAFHYISGAGTRAESRTFWSKVKGQIENELMELVEADCWGPAFIDAEPSASLPKMYVVLRQALRLLRPFRSLYVAGEDLGRAMLEATRENLWRRVIENAEIRELAERS